MKIFNKSDWGEKVNFVDSNNVLLGYDLSQSCCENAGWFISDKIEEDIQEEQSLKDEEDWNFDPDFYRLISSSYEFDEGGMVVFRIVNGEKEKFIHIYNSHNGYYSHGFTFSVGGKDIYNSYI